ncbi:hypothetical protein BGZ73_004997 [Actinomortierella ambigua]|nr:hypothetical protein BGZ73_004997 [Actinomortierella ambigua]
MDSPSPSSSSSSRAHSPEVESVAIATDHQDSNGLQPSSTQNADSDMPQPEESSSLTKAQEEEPLKDPSSISPAPTTCTPADPTDTPRSISPSQAHIKKETPPEPEEIPNVPRLVIEKMVLINFKSYAGRREIGPFHKSFTSIVGPNGSGKSNVIDALLFVFGYRANKMRQGKLSELIHNSTGSEGVDSCTVEIHFAEIIDMPSRRRRRHMSEEDNKDSGSSSTKEEDTEAAPSVGSDDKHSATKQQQGDMVDLDDDEYESDNDQFERVPNSTLVVSRVAYQNNSSKYYVNNFVSSYTAVTSLLKGRGIDLDHKRFLILQGEVESISQMKPKAQTEHDEGLLEYLEDIIGTSSFKESIEKSASELDKLNEERAERLRRVKFVEAEKEALEEKKKEAEAYLRDENSLAVKLSAMYQIKISDNNKKIARDTKAMEQLRAKLEEDDRKHQSLKEEVQNLEDGHVERVNEYEQLGKDANEANKELTKYDREEVQMTENKKHLKNKEKKMTKSLQADKYSLTENQSWVKNHETDLVKFQADLERLEKGLVEAEDELENIRLSLKGKTEEFSQQIEEHQRKLIPWTEKIIAKQREVDMAQSEHDLLEDKANRLRVAYEDAEAGLHTQRVSQKNKEKEIVELKGNIERSARQIEEMERKLKAKEAEEQAMRSKVTAARQRADEARMSQQKAQSRSAVLTALLRQRDLGRISGIRGRLGNLGTIDDLYDVAISTACPALDNIVVNTVEAGQQCIDFVRKQNLGRVTLIVLDELPKRDLSKIPTPENVPRLFDLVKPADPAFAPAFYSVMQDTLVARDLTHANQIAFGKQRWRVVTMDGQLIDKAGTMTGGGTRVMRGAMGSSVADEFTPEAVQRLAEQQEQIETEFRMFQQEKMSLERELQSTRTNIPKMEMRQSMLQVEVNAIKKQMDDAVRRVEQLKREAEPKPSEVAKIKALAEKADVLRKEVEAIKLNTVDIEAKIKELQNKILDAGGVKLRAQKSKVEGLREQIEALGDRITKTRVAKNKAEKDIIKLQASTVKLEKDLEGVMAELADLEEKMKEKAAIVATLRKKHEDIKNLMEDKREQIEEMKRDLDDKLKAINKIRTAEAEMKNKVDDLEQNLAEYGRRVHEWTELKKKLTIHKVDYGEGDVPAELVEIPEEDLGLIDLQELQTQISELEQRLSASRPNLGVLDEYRRREEEYMMRAKDLEDMTALKDEAKKQYDELRKKRLEQFMTGFLIISQRLKEMYQMITMGGNAELELVDSLDPFSEGIVFSVMPPKKSWKNIANLSGGEKTLSSLALVFALHHYKPTPLYVMDEIDAALDFRNVSIVANYIKERTRNAQFVIISLRNNMFELADRLVGIYKTDNKTKSITINPLAMRVLRLEPVHADPKPGTTTGHRPSSVERGGAAASGGSRPSTVSANANGASPAPALA